MSLKEKIHQDLNEALKSKEELKTSVLRLLSSSILNKEKEKRYKFGKAEDVLLTDEEIIDVISSEAKKRKEAIELYEKGGREGLAQKEKSELEILQKYLPEQLSEEELRRLVKEAVAKTGAKEQKDMGKVMAELMPKVRGKSDGSLVSKIVKELLSAFLFLFLLGPVFADGAEIWTNGKIIEENVMARVLINNAYRNDDCHFYLVSPQGEEFYDGFSQCSFTGFYTTSKLKDNFGNWKVKAVVQRNNKEFKTLSYDFEYKLTHKYYSDCFISGDESIVGKKCDFLGRSYFIKGKGNFPATFFPNVSLSVKYDSMEDNLTLITGDQNQITDGVFINNAGVIKDTDFQLFLEYLPGTLVIDPTNNLLRINLYGDFFKTRNLPDNQDAIFITKIKMPQEVSISVDRPNKLVIINSQNKIAATNSKLKIVNGRFSLDDGQDFIMMPDEAHSIIEKYIKLTSVKIDLINTDGQPVYSVKDFIWKRILAVKKVGFPMEIKVNASTREETFKVSKPWWGFLAW